MKKILATALLFLLAVPDAWSDPHPQAEEIQAYRDTVMDGLGKSMKATAMLVKEKVDRQDDAIHHARSLHGMSVLLCGLFPEGTGPDAGIETRALPVIWESWADYETACKKFEAESKRLVEIAESGDFESFKAQFGNVGGACGECHDRFRAEEE
ncbi:MAG: cytochrome c [Deltaproteobacteria bacterium]|nr:cytochrome c [Deltaproteobacteria bacterium]